jgi:hypothetical protein
MIGSKESRLPFARLRTADGGSVAAQVIRDEVTAYQVNAEGRAMRRA